MSLTKEDIDNIISAHRAVFATKEDFLYFKDELIKNFSSLQTAVDGYSKRADTYFQEMVVLSHKVHRLEKWIQQVAEKVGVKLEY